MAQTTHGVPYPLPDEPVAEGAARIRDVAEYVDAHVLAELLAAGEVRSYTGQPEAIRLGGIPGFPAVYFGASGAIYGSGASSIRTDSAFTAAGALATGGPVYITTNGSIYFGAANDTNLYRTAAGVLQTDGSFVAAKDLQAYGNAFVDLAGANKGLYFGAAFDTVLYRSAPATLKTDGSIEVGLNLAVRQHVYVDQAGAGFMVLFGAEGDTRLSRAGVNVLRASGTIEAGNGGAQLTGGALTFGGDTNLYRVGAGYLKTDQSLIIGGKLRYGNWAEAANVGAGLVARLPIYDVNETRAGYLHVYDS